MAQNKWFIEKALKKIDQDIIDKLQLTGELVSGAAKKNSPVKTGALRNSIDFDVDKKEQAVRIGTNLFYAPWIELGTKFIKPQWYLTRALGENIGKIKAIFAKEKKW